ncbi:MAG: FAD:protein FMN transferase [Acidimicrobiales bacterium]
MAVVRHAEVMGTMASIHVHDDLGLVGRTVIDAAIDEVLAELERLEAMFSTFRPSSEISRVNRGELALVDCSQEVIDVLDACTWLEHSSNGAFHVFEHGRIDPAGFVKGWATERASRLLLDHGLEHWYVGVGGDIVVHGAPAGRDCWTIAIADPTRRSAVITGITVTEGAVATSGTAERGRHLWDADGEAADTWASVTVIGPSLTWADAFATTACAMGPGGLDWVGRFDGYQAFAVTHQGALVNTRAA